MTLKLVGLALLPIVLAGGAVINTSLMIVDVHDGDRRLVVPVPLVLAQIALVFAPDDVKRITVPAELVRVLPAAERLITQLRGLQDTELVSVTAQDEKISISKQGHFLLVDVREHRAEQVRVKLPLAGVAAMLESYDSEGGFFRTSKLISALRSAPSGRFVHVIDGDDEISIRFW